MLNAAGPLFMIVCHWEDTITPHNACRLLQYLKLYLLRGLLMLFHPLFSMFWAHSHYTLKGNQLPPKNSKKGYHLSVLNLLHAHPENTFLATSLHPRSKICRMFFIYCCTFQHNETFRCHFTICFNISNFNAQHFIIK